MKEPAPRRFWEYRESDGTITNKRVKFVVAAALLWATLAAIPALIGGISNHWPLIPCGALVGALGATLAHAIDYISDRKAAAKCAK